MGEQLRIALVTWIERTYHRRLETSSVRSIDIDRLRSSHRASCTRSLTLTLSPILASVPSLRRPLSEVTAYAWMGGLSGVDVGAVAELDDENNEVPVLNVAHSPVVSDPIPPQSRQRTREALPSTSRLSSANDGS